MGVGPMPARRAHRDGHPDRRLLAEADAERARGLAGEEAVAEHQVPLVLEHPARAPGPERLLVRDGRVGQAPFEPITERV